MTRQGRQRNPQPSIAGRNLAVDPGRTRAHESLENSEHRFRALTENSVDLICLTDASGRISYANSTLTPMGGYSADELLGQPFLNFTHLEDAPQMQADFTEVLRNPRGTLRRELRFRHKNGTYVVLEAVIRNALGDPAVKGIVINARDVTERKQAEQSLRRMVRALKTLSAGNSAVVHAASEEQLLQSMCRAIVDSGGYPLAWVGYAEQDAARSVRPVAWAGADAEYVRMTDQSWADVERGRGPTGRCIRTGKPQVTREISSDPSMALWREQARKHGYQSSLALPIAGPAGVFGVLGIYATEVDAFDASELGLLSEMAGDLAYGILALRTSEERRGAEEKLRLMLEGTIAAVGAIMEARDPYTAGHQRRVASLGAAIAAEMGLPEKMIEGIRLGGLIHDIGKIQIPAEILSKPTRLSKPEFDLIKIHPQAGYDMVKGIDFPWPIALIVLQHHERLDGSGYPQGLKGAEIIPEARILAVADVVEAMSSHRPYRPGFGIDFALAEIETKKGACFDAKAVEACLKLFRSKGFSWAMTNATQSPIGAKR